MNSTDNKLKKTTPIEKVILNFDFLPHMFFHFKMTDIFVAFLGYIVYHLSCAFY
jgi:hypothetical protein